MDNTLRDFELRIRVDYTYRSLSAMKVAAEVASKLGGTTLEMLPVKGRSEPEVRIELSVTSRPIGMMVVTTTAFSPMEYNQIRDKEVYLSCQKETLLYSIIDFLFDGFREKLGWTDEN